MRKSVLLLAALALVACSGSAFAADADRGKEFARRVCALCHVVMEGQNPRNPDAPSFQAIATSQQFREKGMEVLQKKSFENAEFSAHSTTIRRRGCLYQITCQIAAG